MYRIEQISRLFDFEINPTQMRGDLYKKMILDMYGET
jgi:hypothetical protein